VVSNIVDMFLFLNYGFSREYDVFRVLQVIFIAWYYSFRWGKNY